MTENDHTWAGTNHYILCWFSHAGMKQDIHQTILNVCHISRPHSLWAVVHEYFYNSYHLVTSTTALWFVCVFKGFTHLMWAFKIGYNFCQPILVFLHLVLYWEPPEWMHSRDLLVSAGPSFGSTCLFYSCGSTLSNFWRQEEVLMPVHSCINICWGNHYQREVHHRAF